MLLGKVAGRDNKFPEALVKSDGLLFACDLHFAGCTDPPLDGMWGHSKGGAKTLLLAGIRGVRAGIK